MVFTDHDAPGIGDMLAMLLRSPVAFIGVMGSRRHVAHYVEDLRSRGFADEDLARIQARSGSTSAVAAPVALSIAAGLVAARHGREGVARPVTNASGRTARAGPGEAAGPGRRMAGAVLAAIAVAVAAARPVPDVRPDARPNVIVVLTDDRRWDTLEAMPWLRGELARDGSGWATLPLAFANTPLCCPSRASLLTGAYAHHTAVVDNGSGTAWMSRRRSRPGCGSPAIGRVSSAST